MGGYVIMDTLLGLIGGAVVYDNYLFGDRLDQHYLIYPVENLDDCFLFIVSRNNNRQGKLSHSKVPVTILAGKQAAN